MGIFNLEPDGSISKLLLELRDTWQISKQLHLTDNLTCMYTAQKLPEGYSVCNKVKLYIQTAHTPADLSTKDLIRKVEPNCQYTTLKVLGLWLTKRDEKQTGLQGRKISMKIRREGNEEIKEKA